MGQKKDLKPAMSFPEMMDQNTIVRQEPIVASGLRALVLQLGVE